jgi:hypothetical protein
MAIGCIFCGGTPATREHLWPDWLRREVQIREAFAHRIEQETDGVETRDISFTTPPFNQVVKAMCGRCNGGWMSNIEANAKPILRDLIYANGRTLEPDEQRKLASWAFLKACVFDELHPNERVVPLEHRQRLYTYKQPPATQVAIWLGTYEALPALVRAPALRARRHLLLPGRDLPEAAPRRRAGGGRAGRLGRDAGGPQGAARLAAREP